MLVALLLLLADGPETALATLMPTPTADARPAAPAPLLRLELLDRRPEGFEAFPPLSPRARYAKVPLGEGEARLAFDVPEGAEALGHLHEEGAREPVRGRATPFRGGFHVRFDGVRCAGLPATVTLTYRGGALEEAALAGAEHRRGRVAIGGAVREVILVDGDLDGRYDGPKDRWVAFRVDRLAQVPALTLASMMLLDEPQVPFERDGRALHVARVRPDGTALSLVLGPPRKSVDEVLDRRYAEVQAAHFERFAREAETFAREWGLDRARPRASAAAWRRMPFAEAKEAARRAGKPLLVEFFSETNPYSWLARYWSYPDREVDQLLSKFVLVSIDVDKDPERTSQVLGVKALPALVPLAPGGARVTFDLLVRAADGSTKDLAGEQAISGWHRPQELAENLRRVLAKAR